MSESRVLILDADDTRLEQLTAVLDFVECLPEGVADAAQLDISSARQQQWMAVIIGRIADPAAFEKFMNWFREDPLAPPVLLLPEHHGHAQRERLGLDEEACWELAFPTRYVQLSELLMRASGRQLGSKLDRRQTSATGPTGQSPEVRKLRMLIQQVAGFDTTVLILGESGTGKEVAAREIHECSDRAGKPFVAINCGAIPAELLESELFGHEKGSFTGAVASRKGRFEMAEGGTLFLDEIGDMSLPMQVKLLRVLQEKSYERVGSNASMPTNVRIIAATHRDLEQRISDGEFREDLFYRLNVFPIEMPPLRERVDDIPELIADIINRLDNTGSAPVRFSKESIQVLAGYAWPGNVRELANLIERMAVLHAGKTIRAADLPERYQPAYPAQEAPEPEALDQDNEPRAEDPLASGPIDLREYLAKVEQRLIRRALEESNGVVAHAAQLLQLRRTTLVEKIRKFGISVD